MRCGLGQQRALGRTEGGQRFGPRPLDLDVVFYEGMSFAHGGLEIPHPRWRERPFVMVLLVYHFTAKPFLENLSGTCHSLPGAQNMFL